MFNSSVLDIAVGLFFVYFLLSVIASHINEIIANLFSLRATSLEKSIQNLLKDSNLEDKIWSHPFVQGLAPKEGRKPSYIPSNTFALAVFDAIVPSTGKPTALEEVEATLRQNLPESTARQALLTIVGTANGDINKARAGVENWFNAAMDRLSGEYKRRLAWITLGVALVISVVFGVDTIDLASNLWHAQGARALVASTAQVQPTDLQAAVQMLSQLPVGWNGLPATANGWIFKILGLLLTTIAVSLGAPFWFDLLSKVVNLRSSGPKPPTPSETAKLTPATK